MDHIGPHRIFELSQLEPSQITVEMTKWEREHLRDCEQCQRILAIFAREFDKHNPPYDRPA
jgi:hypothetical protein